MKQKFILIALLIVSILSFTGCELNEEPILTDSGSVKMPLDTGVIIMEGHNRLFSLTADYPILYISSIFSLTEKAPEIAYIGQVQDIVQIPLKTSDQFSTNCVIHNHGGYLVKIGLLKQGTNEVVPCVIKMKIDEGEKGANKQPSEIYIQYEIYRNVK